jgi:hypothetical protein
MRKYFYTDGKTKYGPFSKDELTSKSLTRRTKIWYLGLDDWTELSDVPDLNDIISAIPPELKPLEELRKNKTYESEVEKKPIYTQILSNFKKTYLRRWVLGISISAMALFIIQKINQRQSEVNLQKEIVANAYDSNIDFDVYVEKFYRDLEFHGISPKKPKTTIIKFSRLDQLDRTTHMHALSLGHNDDDRIEIYINPSSWEKFSKSMKYFVMYHELVHDVLNLDDLKAVPKNEGKLMYPEIAHYGEKTMDEFIESFHALFEELAKK